MSFYWRFRHIRAGCIVVFGSRESPALGLHVPMYGRVWNDGLEAFELTDDQRSVGPGTCVRDLGDVVRIPIIAFRRGSGRRAYIEMVSSFLRREFPTLLNEVSELRLTSLEFSGLVIRGNPVCDLLFGLQLPSN